MSEQQQTQNRSSLELHHECREFYNREAELLDDRRLKEWLDILTKDVQYEMPIRTTREKGAERSEFSEEGFNYREDYSTLEARVERFESEYAWSDDPPSRTRHFVTNVRVGESDDDELWVKTNLLLFRAQGGSPDQTLLSAERHDVLRRVDGDLKLADRDIRLDHTVLPMKNIPVFF